MQCVIKNSRNSIILNYKFSFALVFCSENTVVSNVSINNLTSFLYIGVVYILSFQTNLFVFVLSQQEVESHLHVLQYETKIKID